MRTLLTGSKGQLAHCFRDRLPDNWELIATDSSSLDITDADAVRNMVQSFQPDAIVNAAAYTAVDRAETNVPAAFAVNAAAVHNLADAARSVHARFIHVSTDYVFDGQAKRPIVNMTTPIRKAYMAALKLQANYSRLPLILKARLSVPLGYLANTAIILLKPCCAWQKNETAFPLSTIKSDARPMRGFGASHHYPLQHPSPSRGSTTSAATNLLLGMNSVKLSFKQH